MGAQKRRLSRSQTIILGFAAIILVGTALLLLPFATKAGQQTDVRGALFTAVSSTCVTGLVVYDTFAHWTLFGQLVLLMLIQIGGLGFITISTFFMIVLRKKIGLSRRALIQESLSTLQIKGSVLLVRRIITGTLVFEGMGAVLLALRFVPRMGFWQGIYYGIFHSVSAFCNAGFDLMGCAGEYSSFCSLWNDPVAVLTLCALIIIGGIGFVVWEDIYLNKWHWKKYHFHTKAVLVTSLVLVVGGAALYLAFEKNNLFAGKTFGEKLLLALFAATSPRTAGFNTIDLGAMTNGSFVLTLVLMFIGGSPGSTAGGIKTTTVFAAALYIKAYLLRQKDCVAFNARMDDEAVKKASIVIFINLLLVIFGSTVIFAAQQLPFEDVLFEVVSAGGTVGMTTGITRQLVPVSQYVIMLLMFFGRMGSLTFAMSFTENRKAGQLRYPKEQVTIG